MTVHEFIGCGWKTSRDFERILSVSQVRDFVVIVTDYAIYRAEWQYGVEGDLRVIMVCPL